MREPSGIPARGPTSAATSTLVDPIHTSIQRKGTTIQMHKTYKILIMGASYGSLLGTKLALAGHSVHLICLPIEADLINKEGAIVRMPVKGREGLVEIN